VGVRLDAVAEVHDVRPASHLLEDVLRAGQQGEDLEEEE